MKKKNQSQYQVTKDFHQNHGVSPDGDLWWRSTYVRNCGHQTTVANFPFHEQAAHKRLICAIHISALTLEALVETK